VLPSAAVAAGLTRPTVWHLSRAGNVIHGNVAVGPFVADSATTTTCVDSDTVRRPTVPTQSTPTTFRVRYRLAAGPTAAADGGGTPPRGNGSALTLAAAADDRRSMAWTPGDEWDETLYKVRVRFELPWGLAVIATTAPGAVTAVVSSGTLGNATIIAAPPTVTFPFAVVARATKFDK